MTFPFRLFLSILVTFTLIQFGHAKTSTDNLIVEQSDIHEFNKSTEIEEGDFFENIPTTSEKYDWVVNIKKGPFSSIGTARNAVTKLKEEIGLTLTNLEKEVSVGYEIKYPKNNSDLSKLSWVVNFKLSLYKSKDLALQVAKKLE
ncbi:uncharacterized protein METZ01_LOCUS251954, partial [marine metagenome]